MYIVLLNFREVPKEPCMVDADHNYLRECLAVQRSWSPHPGAACAAPLLVLEEPWLGLDCLALPAALPEVGLLLARRGTQCQSHSGQSPHLRPGKRLVMHESLKIVLFLTTFIDSS